MSRAWYAYNGTGNVANTSSYIYTTLSPNCGSGTQTMCAVYGEFVDGSPNPKGPFTYNLQTYIGNAISSSNAQPALPSVKRFVYVRIPD